MQPVRYINPQYGTFAEALAAVDEEWERPVSERSVRRALLDERGDPGGLGDRVAAQREHAVLLRGRRSGERHPVAAGELAERHQERLAGSSCDRGEDDEAGPHFAADLFDGLDGRVRAEVDDPPAT